jgi:putative transposase
MERLTGRLETAKSNERIDDKRNSNLIGVQVFHNYIRPHEGLEGKTPAEACRIELKQEDKYNSLIENASIKIKRFNYFSIIFPLLLSLPQFPNSAFTF